MLRKGAGPRVLLVDKDLGAPPGKPGWFVVVTEALQFYPALVVIYAGAQTGTLGDRALTAREHALPKPFMLKALTVLAQEVWRAEERGACGPRTRMSRVYGLETLAKWCIR